MANAITMDTSEMRELFSEGIQSMRINYYPPCPQPELVMGLNPHSDGGGLTILLQANEVEGLQIKKDGQWVPIKPLPNAFIINIGDLLEVIIFNFDTIIHIARYIYISQKNREYTKSCIL